jgi:energy-coupling factor transporter ATP-binding protein EcfA2
VIRITGLSHRVLGIPDLALPEGRVAVIGPDGGGKTTLLRLLAGIDLPVRGEVLVDGLPPREREVGWVGENPGETLVFSRVYDEIASPLRFRNDPCALVDERVEAVAGDLGILDLLGRGTGDLSAGEKARVALAAALAAGPAILVLDETDSSLDAESAAAAEAVVGRAPCPHVVQATQRMALAARADHLLYLEGGRVLHSGGPSAVFAALSGTPFSPPPRGWCP